MFLSLSTVNTGSEQLCLYLKWLIVKLSKQDKNWQETTVLLLDGASYHRSKETRNYLANKGVKVVIGGPYAFSAAPVEHYFSALKRFDLNPDNIKTGKK